MAELIAQATLKYTIWFHTISAGLLSTNWRSGLAGLCATLLAPTRPCRRSSKGSDTYPKDVYTRYELHRQYVLHCHTLDHEHQGMMQNVQILPDGQGGTAAHAH